MKTFLDTVAGDLLARHGGNLEHICVVFPGKRARLFLNEALLDQAGKPIWSPQYSSITQLFEQLAHGSVMETVPAVIRLYNIYSQLRARQGLTPESLDHFWGWGEIILSDFDDIDKHLVDAEQIFRNAAELSEMDDLGFLSEKQKAALEMFFDSFKGDRRTELQKRFLELWNIMPELYRTLCSDGSFPYEGAMQRAVVEDESLLAGLDPDMEYCFVGFNMLSATEKRLMKFLDRRGQAHFYWDYDDLYLNNTDAEAGDFMRENLRDFPSELKKNSPNGPSMTPSLTFVAASTDSMATRYIPLWLKDNLTSPERDTALVLCDEKKLIPVLHSIPDCPSTDGVDKTGSGSPENINITMGYPLNSCPIYSLMMALVSLQTEGWDDARNRFRYTFQKAVERHPYSSEIGIDIWQKRTDSSDACALAEYLDECTLALFHESEDVLYTESIFLTHRALRQFSDSIRPLGQPLSAQTIRRLMRRMLGSLSIPFHGEPAVGLQVMGLLETRCLDFRNVLLLNTEEGLLPAGQSEASLIPNTLRTGFGLTTVRHRTAVFAYYFYRLLQRAEHVTMVYNQSNVGIAHHEMSRFLRQLQAETDIPIKVINLEAGQDVQHFEIGDINKTPDIIDRLHQMYDKSYPDSTYLSPSAINVYLDCPMKFYLKQLCGLSPEKDSEDGIDARVMGIIIHNISEDVYNDIISHQGRQITAEAISTYTKDHAALLQQFIDKEFRKVADVTEYRGENVLIRNVVERYVTNLLKWDSGLKEFSILEMEKPAYLNITVPISDKEELQICTGGRIDRMDRTNLPDGSQCVRIVDYKTGSREDAPLSVDDLFKRSKKHASYWLQTFLYAIAAKETFHIRESIRPTLFYLGKAAPVEGRYDPTLVFSKDKDNAMPVLDIADYANEYIERLKELIRDIFDPEVPFHKCEEHDACTYCDFCGLCGR